ncbi:Bug family tripartite tricarboxylate transporter substrate binding protein [Falsiroseomonas selenitidurans]|uniref:Tripartite tricarboxylate transporter substrate binding protein n=1 Tax=Falsiroseomonas selenitidurans TaxID=2716335 RepID=A0ABX1E9Z5_9PROT|nr:tripartite tricarboxylate transporter substrate-binding protein [Falsiroseomonas selenitidurans]NKC33630.1 tripartite tricarboxylate transporter substrate binding protein [Falsiroseomonas selenitidurans]
MIRRRDALLGLSGLTATLAGTAGQPRAQSFPTRPVRMVIPFTAGGSNDVVGRMLADGMAQRMGQPMVVENRGGAGGLIGNDVVAKADPDGYTMLLAGSGSFVISSLVQPRLPYDPVKDFAAICWLGASPNVITVHPSVQATNLRELQALGRARREPLRYGTPGVGTNGHALGAMIGVVLGIEMEPVHYRGTGPALNDLLGGRLDLLTNASAPLQPHIQAGKIRALAIAGRSRSVALPELSTSVEQGFPELDSSTWYGLLAPAGTPAERIAILHRAAVATMNDAEVKRRLVAAGVDEIAPSPEPAHFTRLLASDRARWEQVVQRAQLRLQ